MQDNKDLILQAIESAEKSLEVARKLLGGGVAVAEGKREKSELLGEIGTFDGENLVTETGQHFQVPPNYASKSLLLVGDVMRMVTGSDGVRRFKQIQKVPRVQAEGILTKKDGLWSVVSDRGTFRVLPASVKYFSGEIGDEVRIVLPKDHTKLKAKWAALKQVIKESKPEKSELPPAKKAKRPSRASSAAPAETKAKEEPQPAAKKEEKKEKDEAKKQPPKKASPQTKKSKLKGEIKVSAEELR